MARLRDLKNNYTSGELDESLFARVDNQHYFNGARRMRNVIVLPQGGWKPRPGTAYVATVPLISETVSNTRLIPHVISTRQTFLVMLHNAGAKIYKNGVQVKSFSGQAWLSAELPEISWTQNLDTLLLFQNQRRPRALQRQGADATWASFDWPLNNIPIYAFPDGTVYVNGVNEVQELVVGTGASTAWQIDDPFTLTLGGEETSSILWTNVQATLATRVQTALRNLSITSATGITVVTDGLDALGNYKFIVTIGGADGGKPWGEMVPVVKANNFSATAGYPIFVSVTTKGDYPGEDTWSNTRGWPRCGVFYQGRLLMAGSTQRPSTLWASRSGDQQDFNKKETADDYGFEVTADTDDVASFHHIFVSRHLQLFASQSEFYVPISEDVGLTPTNFALRKSTAVGSKSGLPVFSSEGATIFVQAERKLDPTALQQRGIGLREFIFTNTELAYQSNTLSLLAPHLIRDPSAITVLRQTGATSCDYLLMSNKDDGTLTWFCTLRSQEVNAFSLQETDGFFTDVGVDGNDIYCVVQRQTVLLPGVDRFDNRYLERFVDGLFVDSAVYDFAVGAPVNVVNVLHLVGRTVAVYVDGNWRDPVVVPLSGNVTLDPPAEDNYQVGLAWPVVDEDGAGHVYTVKDLPPAKDLPDGTTFGRKMRVVQADVSVIGMRDLIVSGNRITNAQVGVMTFDAPPPLFTGVKRITGFLGWGEGVLSYGNVVPGPVTVRGVAKKVAV